MEDQTETTDSPDLLATLQDQGATITVHEPERVARAAAVDEDGVVVGVELIDADAPPQRDGLVYVEVHDDEPVQTGWAWDGQHWTAPKEPRAALDYAAAGGDEELRRDVDALLGLLLTAQAGGPVPDVDWRAILTGMVERGTAGEHELRGAHGWGLLEADELDDLLAAAQPPTDPGA